MKNTKGLWEKKIRKEHIKRVEHLYDVKGFVTPQIVVEDARDKRSPLHELFEWDKDKAAHLWLLKQARDLLTNIKVHIEGSDDVRAFVNVNIKTLRGEKSVYVTLQEALSKEELRAQVLNDAYREVLFWRRKYSTLKELSKIFKAVDDYKE